MKSIILSLLLLGLILFQGCGVYSFTGASISADVKTITIAQFYNNAPLGPSNMSALFTEKIKDYFQQNTSLELVESNGDLQLDGLITNYTITPVGANSSGNDQQIDLSNFSRITITVNASYINTKNDEFDFDKKFSQQSPDFDSDTDLAATEEQFVEAIFDQIILDIFNASVANW